MKILALGDLHGNLPEKIPMADLILLTGDFGRADLARKIAFKQMQNPDYEPTNNQIKKGCMQIYNSTLSILKKLNKLNIPVYYVYGNTEIKDSEVKKLNKEIKLKLPLIEEKIRKLTNLKNISGKIKKIDRIKIAGYSYFRELAWIKRFIGEDEEYLFKNKKDDKKARKFFSKLEKADILLVHQPPYGILDKVTAKFAPKSWKGKHSGSKIILKYIKRKQPKYAICGHIHEAKGEKELKKTKIINLGSLGYKLIEI